MAFLIDLHYEDGRHQMVADPVLLDIDSLELAKAYAGNKVQSLNREFVSSIVGKVAAYELLKATPVYKEKVEEEASNENE